MDTLSLLAALKKLNLIYDKKFHVGVYSSDRLPNICRKPAAVIHNDQSSLEPGRHWTCSFLPARGRAEFFCSYGLPPLVVTHKRFLNRNSKGFVYNKKCFQALDSEVCGLYCLLYLSARMKNISRMNYCKLFSNDTIKNDKIVAERGKYLLKQLRGVQI